MWTGAGEWIWRPLVNPIGVRVNSFVDRDPRGFGLMQRDRNFDHYQVAGVFYDKRPSVWVEPQGSWGEGAVMPVEHPTADERFEDIVAFWSPKTAIVHGKDSLSPYRRRWGPATPVHTLTPTHTETPP